MSLFQQPKPVDVKKRSSTVERKLLGEFIRQHGKIMPKACSHCNKAGRVCRVHVRSGRCSECNIRNLRGCNIKITESEWSRLHKERSKLLSQIRDARAASAAALEVERSAREATSTARSKEERLEKQLELLDKRAEDAVSVSESNAREIEVLEESLSSLPEASSSVVPELALSPFS